MSEQKELIPANAAAMVPSFITTGGASGFESMDSDCISIPFLRLAQSNTPEAQPGSKQIKGLAAGNFFNPSTGRIYGESAKFIMLGFYRSWNEWFGSSPDAKFVASLSNDVFEQRYRSKVSEVKDATGKVSLQDAAGNRFQDTRNFFLLSADHPEDGVLLYPMTSTGIPASKKWLAKANAIRAEGPDGSLTAVHMYSRIWELKVNFIQSPKGNYFQVSDTIDKGWIEGKLVPIIKASFDEAQSYIRDRSSVVEAHKETEPDWVNEK